MKKFINKGIFHVMNNFLLFVALNIKGRYSFKLDHI